MWRRVAERKARREGVTAPPAYPTSPSMNYILALLLPPLSIFLAGRPILGIVTFLIWVPAILVPGGVLTHPVFIVLAWIIIFERNRDRA